MGIRQRYCICIASLTLHLIESSKASIAPQTGLMMTPVSSDANTKHFVFPQSSSEKIFEKFLKIDESRPRHKQQSSLHRPDGPPASQVHMQVWRMQMHRDSIVKNICPCFSNCSFEQAADICRRERGLLWFDQSESCGYLCWAVPTLPRLYLVPNHVPCVWAAQARPVC